MKPEMPGLPLALVLALLLGVAAPAQDWPHWRGPEFDGSSTAKDLPVDIAKTKHVRWVTALPGPAASTPIVVGERVFLTSCDIPRDQLVALCLNRADGKVLWQKDAGSGYRAFPDVGARIGHGTRTSYASPSPVFDGERVIFFFGNGDLVAYDTAGEEVWRRNVQEEYGTFAFQWTFSASPTVSQGRLFLPVLQRDTPVGAPRSRRGGRRRERGQREDKDEKVSFVAEQDQEQPTPIESFILAVDAKTGKTLYRHVRPSPAQVESLESYTTMIPYVGATGRKEMLLAGGDVVTGHDPATGRELWRWGTWNEGHRERSWRLVPSVVVGDGVALVCAPKRDPVYAIRLGGEGLLDEKALVWESEGRPNPVSSDVPTPAYEDGHFYVLSDVRSALSKVRAKDGEIAWTLALPNESLWRASPTVADGKVWFMNHAGDVAVVDAEKGELLHQTRLADDDEDGARSTLLAAHDSLFVRTNSKLYCFGK